MSLISDLCRELSPTQFEEAEKCIFFEIRAKKLAEGLIYALSEQMGFSQNKVLYTSCSLDAFDVIPTSYSLGEEKGMIYFPALAFLSRKDIPFTNQNDRNLNSREKVQDFHDHVSTLFNLSKKKVTVKDCYNLRLFLHLIHETNHLSAKNAIKFALGHELGHIFYHHTRSQKARKTFNPIQRYIENKKDEKEADYFSYSFSSEFAEGGIHIFRLIQDRSYLPVSMKVLNVFLRISLSITHGSCSSRIKNIQHFYSNL